MFVMIALNRQKQMMTKFESQQTRPAIEGVKEVLRNGRGYL